MVPILIAGYVQREREREREETVDHVLSPCPTAVNTEYLQRHYQVTSFIHWILCKNFNLPDTEKWYRPQPVTEKHRSNNSMGLHCKYRQKDRGKPTRYYNKKCQR